jgi:hypothetical protein
MRYRLVGHDGKLRVYVNDLLVLQTDAAPAAITALRLTVMHEKFWLANVTVSPYAPAETAAAPTDADYLIREDFQSGRISPHWQASGTWEMVPDPDHPAHQVIAASASGTFTAALKTLRNDFTDYTLTFRMRFDTDYKPYPKNDNKHYPSCGIIVKQGAGANISAMDNYVWNYTAFTGVGSCDPVIQPAHWYNVQVVCQGGHYQWWVGGKRLIDGVGSPRSAGALGFTVMDGTLRVDDIKAVAHPDALVYGTFVEGLDRWKTEGQCVVEPTPGRGEELEDGCRQGAGGAVEEGGSGGICVELQSLVFRKSAGHLGCQSGP